MTIRRIIATYWPAALGVTLIAVGLIILLTGCGASKPHITPTQPPPTTAAAPPEFTAAQQTFISDARSQFNVGGTVSDSDLAQVGQAVCTAAQAGVDRKALDLVPAANGISVTGSGADSLVTIAISNMCPGDMPTPTWHTLARFSGTGQQNSQTFKILGGNPVLRVTYRFRGNTSGYGGDNFIADLVSRDDDIQIANVIAVGGSKTTRLYPDLSYGGSPVYHLEVQATGPWTVVVRQRY
jgi:hypothetical protein